MFSAVASKYDRLNRILSFNQDRRWRQQAVAVAAIRDNAKILDLCTGTAETAIEFGEKCSGCRIFGVDFSLAMLEKAESKISRLGFGRQINLVEADILQMPFRAGYFDAVSISFGLRNLADYRKGMGQISAMLKKGGCAVILEFSPSCGSFFGKAADAYIKILLPLFARVCGGSKQSYGYLASSISSFLCPQEILDCMAAEGLVNLKRKDLGLGIINAYYGEKP